jgi:hypothetical protein
MTSAWPWIMLAGLGAFHGLNPAMGWLFAVALGLHRRSRSAVYLALIPIAIGHFLSVVLVAGAFVATGMMVETTVLSRIAGLALIGWAAYHATYGHRHRVRFGMQVRLAGLAAWSFLMATAHGAGLMLIPALMPICFGGGADARPTDLAIAGAVAATLVHSASMLIVTGAVAVTVYEWVGLSILRSAWINVDFLWTLALAAAGVFLLVY